MVRVVACGEITKSDFLKISRLKYKPVFHCLNKPEELTLKMVPSKVNSKITFGLPCKTRGHSNVRFIVKQCIFQLYLNKLKFATA